MTAESHGVGKDRTGVKGTPGQNGCAVLDLIVGAASLDEEAWAENISHVAVLQDIQTQRHAPFMQLFLIQDTKNKKKQKQFSSCSCFSV